MTDALDDYVLAHITPEDPYLHRLYRATHTRLLRPRMASGHLQGCILRLLCQLTAPRTVVEIGTYSGYSALAMASGMSQGSRLLTFECNDEQEDFTRPWFNDAPWRDRVDIQMIIGDVFTLLPPMELTIDFAFIDANKRDYVDYYELLFPRLRTGGLLLADNTLWDGHVVNPERQDAQTLGIRAFNDRVAGDPRVESLILPFRDGLTILRKISD